MAAESTWTPIATVNATDVAQVYTFGSIPQTYTDLVLVIYGRSTYGANLVSTYGWLNGDTGSGVTSNTNIKGAGSGSPSSGRNTGSTIYYSGQQTGSAFTANIFSTIIMHIPNYSNTTTFKTILSRYANDMNGDANGSTGAWCSLWRNTNAISAIGIGTDGNVAFATGSIATLYGIKAA
jgi:hypothetical protein